MFLFPAVLLAGLFAPNSVHSDDSVVLELFPAESFVKKESGFPVPIERTFMVPAGEGDFTLHVRNGDAAGRRKASMAIIRVNGEKVVSLPDLCGKLKALDKPISGVRKGINVITVKVIGDTRSQLTISVSGRYSRDAVSPVLAAGAEGLSEARGGTDGETGRSGAAHSGAAKASETAPGHALVAADSFATEAVR